MCPSLREHISGMIRPNFGRLPVHDVSRGCGCILPRFSSKTNCVSYTFRTTIHRDLSVYGLICTSAHDHISRTGSSHFTEFPDCGRGSVLLWRRCDTLCTSGFVEVVCKLLDLGHAVLGHAELGQRFWDKRNWDMRNWDNLIVF